MSLPPPLDPSLDRPLIAGQTREQFHALARAIHEADTMHELALYVGRYQRAMSDIRALASMIDGEILGRLHHFRDVETETDTSVSAHSAA